MDFIITGYGDIIEKKEVEEIIKYVTEIENVLINLLEESKNNEEIIQTVKAVKPRGKQQICIHDNTINSWSKFLKWNKKYIQRRGNN